MFSATGMRMLELTAKGYCCTQIMVLLALEQLDRENPDLVRSAAGLCNGVGGVDGPCGVAAGGLMLLGLYSAKGDDCEEADDKLTLLSEEYMDFFGTLTSKYGGGSCLQILGELPAPQPDRCGELLTKSYDMLRQLLVAHGYDLEEGRTQ